MKRSIILVMLFLAVGCYSQKIDVPVISAQELEALKCTLQEPKLSQWFYIGSENGYHMFVHRDLPEDKFYNIAMSEYKIEDPIIISNDESQWVLMPWGPGYVECKK